MGGRERKGMGYKRETEKERGLEKYRIKKKKKNILYRNGSKSKEQEIQMNLKE